MGDVAMSLHAVKALRKAFPELKITIATKPQFARFYSTIPGANVEVLEKPGNLRCLMKLIDRLKTYDIDCVADIHNVLRSKIIRMVLKITKGVRTASLDKQRGLRRQLKRKSGKEIIPIRHNVLRFCDVFKKLGLPVETPEVEKVTYPVPEGFSREFQECGGDTSMWAGFAPFASRQIKIYPEEQRIRLIGLMSEKYRKVFIFSGPGEEKRFATEMEQRYPNVISVFGRTDIWGEIALMSNLKVLVTMDSSAMHMASLSRTRAVAVWGATHPAAGFYGYGEDPEKDFIQTDLPCRPCSIYGEGKCRRGDFICMNSITPEMIMSALSDKAGRDGH